MVRNDPIDDKLSLFRQQVSTLLLLKILLYLIVGAGTVGLLKWTTKTMRNFHTPVQRLREMDMIAE